MPERQVTYVMSGPQHLPYLVVSLYTLRQHYSGTIAVYAWPESHDIVSCQILGDKRLGIACWPTRPKLRKKDGIGSNSQFLDKIDITWGLQKLKYVGCDVSLYLDADTTVHGDVGPLFDMAEECGFAATQWNDWLAAEGLARKRIEGLRDIGTIPKALIDCLLNPDLEWPSVNGGVWAVSPKSPILPLWYQWTKDCGDIFIADERVLHILQALFCPDEMGVMQDNGRWNSSPKFQVMQKEPLLDEDVRIRHYHGDLNVRPNKSQRGHDIWWALYQKCLLQNIGGIRDWKDGVGNKWIRKLEAS